MKESVQRISDLVKEGSARKIFEQVFDEQTVASVHKLSTKGYFDHLEFLINVGKEAHVFRAMDSSGNFRAVKIYKIETSSFRKMIEYIEGDMRFKGIGKNKRDVVFAWTKKEFKNLSEYRIAGIKVPIAFAFEKNVLAMEFVGVDGIPAKSAKETPFEDIEEFYEKMVDSLARMIGIAKLVHADLSEYNILNLGNEPVIIDCGQSVPLNHPKAKEFFERDLKNLSNYFTKNGLKKSPEELREDLKKRKEELLEKKKN